MENSQRERGLYTSTSRDYDECSRSGHVWPLSPTRARLALRPLVYAWEQPGGQWVMADEYYYDARARPQLGDAEHAAAILRRHPRTPDVVLADGANLRYEFTKLGVYCRTPVKDFEEVIGHGWIPVSGGIPSCFRKAPARTRGPNWIPGNGIARRGSVGKVYPLTGTTTGRTVCGIWRGRLCLSTRR